MALVPESLAKETYGVGEALYLIQGFIDVELPAPVGPTTVGIVAIVDVPRAVLLARSYIVIIGFVSDVKVLQLPVIVCKEPICHLEEFIVLFVQSRLPPKLTIVED